MKDREAWCGAVPGVAKRWTRLGEQTSVVLLLLSLLIVGEDLGWGEEVNIGGQLRRLGGREGLLHFLPKACAGSGSCFLRLSQESC